MSTTDLAEEGPNPFVTDIEADTLANENYRTTRWTGSNLQLTLMSIEPGRDIGLEVHEHGDQFLRVEAGRARVQMGASEDDLPFDREVGDHSYNAVLKNAIDFLHNEWKHKAVCFLSYGGVSAGTRAMQALEPVVLSVGMAPVASAVTVPFAAQFLDDDGVVHANEIMTASATTMLDDLAAQTAALVPRRAAI